MTELRKTLLIYFAVWCASVALAAIGVLWLGLDARIPVDMTAEGVVTKSRSVTVLWYMPGMLTFLYGFLALAAGVETWRLRARVAPVEPGEDAQRALGRYGRTMRNCFAGFGMLGILLQIFTLLRAGGMVAPLGLDREGVVRLMFVGVGILSAYVGNLTPKLPYSPNRALDAARHYRINRFAGWVFTLGGGGFALSALTLPFDRMSQVVGLLIAAMLILPLLRFVWAGMAWRRQKRWEEHEGLV